MRRWPNVGLLLAHRLRRWPNSKPTLGQRLMLAGITYFAKLFGITLQDITDHVNIVGGFRGYGALKNVPYKNIFSGPGAHPIILIILNLILS